MDSKVTKARRVERVHLDPPIAGRVGTQDILVQDISTMGAGIEHYAPLISGSRVHLVFNWQGEEIAADCQIVRSRLERLSQGKEGVTVYRSGFAFETLAPEMRSRVKRMVAWFIMRALEEQRLNARGAVPADTTNMPVFSQGQLSTPEPSVAAEADQRSAPRRRYVTCALEGTRWRWTRSTDATQPANGFTVSDREDDQHIQLLCDAYARSDASGREITRILAQMSLTDDKEDFFVSPKEAEPFPQANLRAVEDRDDERIPFFAADPW